MSRRLLLASGTSLTGVVATHAGTAESPYSMSVLEFGIDPNSNRDLSEEIQRAIDAAVEMGATLAFPPGRYVVGGIIVGRPLQLAGSTGRTMLISPDGGTILKMRGASDVTLAGLNFDGAGRLAAGDSPRQALVSAEDCERLLIESCSILGGAASGLSMTRSSGRVTGNRVGFIQKTGIFALDSKGLEISGNHLHDIGNNGIQVWRTDKAEDGAIVANNRIERVAAQAGGTGQNGNGINIWKAGNVIVANNRVTDCAFSAIRNNSGSNCQILGNSISRTGEVAILVEFAFEGALVCGNLIEQPALGISITNFDYGGRLAIVSNNVIRDARGPIALAETSGTGIGAEADTVVTGNVVENAPDTGIHLGWGPNARNLSATGNIVRNCGIGISASLFAGAQATLIASNVISGSKQAAILGMDHDTPVTGDLAAPGAEIPERIVLNGNLVT